MTPEKQRIAIAEACGWRINTEPPYAGMAWPPALVKIPTYKFVHHDLQLLPDYLSDLNAMHQAEKTLTDYLYYKYCLKLGEGGRKAGPTVQDYNRETISATATQRAEAFLHTVGKWTDS